MDDSSTTPGVWTRGVTSLRLSLLPLPRHVTPEKQEERVQEERTERPTGRGSVSELIRRPSNP